MDGRNEKKDQVFISIVILGILGVILSNLFSNSVNFSVLLVQAVIFIVIMYCIFYAIPSGWKNYNTWIRIPEKGNIELSPDKIDFRNNTYDLLITNNGWRKKYIRIDEVKIHYGGGFISRSDAVDLKRREAKTVSFITFRNNGSGFSLKGSESIFVAGIHKFAVSIVFSNPAGRNEFIKWFDVTVSYKHPHYFNIQVSPT